MAETKSIFIFWNYYTPGTPASCAHQQGVEPDVLEQTPARGPRVDVRRQAFHQHGLHVRDGQEAIATRQSLAVSNAGVIKVNGELRACFIV